MSEPVSALAGATYEGYCRVSDRGPVGMVTLRGDLAADAFAKAVKAATGLALPGQGAMVAGDGRSLAWMSPDELLLFCAYEDAPGQAEALTQALTGQHALAVNVSDARAVLRLEGTAAREVMAKLTPADVAPGAFGPGRMRCSRLAQVAAGFWMPDEASFEVIVFRSVARYAFDLLANAARPGGEVGLFGAP